MEQKLNYRLINKLDQDVINKICAGEVIHRPMNVVKELIENSLDAKATLIEITVKNGGMQQIIIHDNGCGIQKEDLKLVCDRFTTSKLTSLDDFENLTTFGFRGEALSSVSIVAHVTIISKTENSISGYKAEYVDGHIKDENSIVPIASANGTKIIVDNLFYNMPTRRAALKSESNELNLIQDLILKYAIIFSGKCAFILKKYNEKNHLINTKGNNNLFSNIDRLFGQNISKNLIPIDIENEKLDFKINGHFSNNDLNMVKSNFILSINSRLVECISLKKALKDLYSNFLLKGSHPFILLLIEIHPKNIDVNVHPNKNEVCFLYDNEIIATILDYIKGKLQNKPEKEMILNKSLEFSFELEKNSTSPSLNSTLISSPNNLNNEKEFPFKSKMYSPIQSTLNNFVSASSLCNVSKKENDSKYLKATNKTSKQLIRVDPKLQRLDQYLAQPRQKKRRLLELTSLKELREELCQNIDKIILNTISESNFVGIASKDYLLIQHQNNLFMLNIQQFNKELIYQVFLLDFGNFDYIRFSQPLSLKKLLSTYLEVNKIEKTDLFIDNMIELLISKYEMLDDYFSIKINEDCEIETIPILIDNHQPNFAYMPEFIYSLINNVDWTKEKSCFHSFGKAIAQFYSYTPNYPDEESAEFKAWSKIIENTIYPMYKNLLLPENNLQNSFHLITTVDNLYKVFERC